MGRCLFTGVCTRLLETPLTLTSPGVVIMANWTWSSTPVLGKCLLTGVCIGLLETPLTLVVWRSHHELLPEYMFHDTSHGFRAFPCLKEKPVEGDTWGKCKLAWKRGKCASISNCRLCLMVLLILIWKKYFELGLSVCSHVGPLFINKEQKNGCFVMYWMHLQLLKALWFHWHRLPKAKWQHSRPWFRNFPMSILNKPDSKSTEKLLWVYI